MLVYMRRADMLASCYDVMHASMYAAADAMHATVTACACTRATIKVAYATVAACNQQEQYISARHDRVAGPWAQLANHGVRCIAVALGLVDGGDRLVATMARARWCCRLQRQYRVDQRIRGRRLGSRVEEREGEQAA